MPPILASAGAKTAEIFAGLTFRLILIGIIGAMFVDSYVSIRIPLPLLPDIEWTGWKPLAIERGETIKGFAKAQEQARILAEQQLKAKEAEYRDKARKADDEHETTLARVDDATDRYIATHRMCPTDRGSTGATASAAEDHHTGVPESLPANPVVAVSDVDVQRCSGAATYAVDSHNWAVSLEKGD